MVASTQKTMLREALHLAQQNPSLRPLITPLLSISSSASVITLSPLELEVLQAQDYRDGPLVSLLFRALPLTHPVWCEATIQSSSGPALDVGHVVVPAGNTAIDSWFVAWRHGDSHVLGPRGPLRISRRGVDPEADADSPVGHELRRSACIALHAHLYRRR